MRDQLAPPVTASGIHIPWSWCARCQRTYALGTYRIIRFAADALHPHPTTLKLCPYTDCSASTTRDGWHWATIQREHADYPAIPEYDKRYAR
jgi:hypothetical protein